MTRTRLEDLPQELTPSDLRALSGGQLSASAATLDPSGGLTLGLQPIAQGLSCGSGLLSAGAGATLQELSLGQGVYAALHGQLGADIAGISGITHLVR